MNDRQIRVLLVEDEPAYADLHTAMLADGATSRFTLLHATRFDEAKAKLQQAACDIILLDLTLPDSGGLETYTGIKSAAPNLPVVVLTACNDDQLAVQAVRSGAQDYLVKGEFDGRLLARVIRYAIERKRAEEDLRQREEFFRLIMENMHDLVVVLDQVGLMLYASPSCRELLGDPELLKGTNPFEKIHPEDRAGAMQAFQEALATGVGRRIEYRFAVKDGSIRHIESQGSVIHDERGRPARAVVVSRDITERKEAVEVLRQALSDLKKAHEELKATQRQLIQSERLEAVSTFAAEVANEIKNPLQKVILGLDFLAHHGGVKDPRAPKVVADMEKAVQHADGIIRGLLEFSNCRRREIIEENINSIVEQALPVVQNDLVNGRIRLTKDLAEGLPRLRLDPRTLKHVFINLFAGAIRDMSDGGKLAVRTYARRVGGQTGPEITLPASFKPADTVVVTEVEEAGDRSPEAGEKPLATRSPGARDRASAGGLGMTVLKKIVELHGGVIDAVQREPGSGKFTVVFRADP